MMGSIRVVTRNVKRWRNKDAMIKRWVTLGVCRAASKFRSINGKQGMPALVAALRKPSQIDVKVHAA